MKNKYQRLSKEEKKKAIEEYKSASETNENLLKRLKRLKMLSIFGSLYAIVSFILDFIFDTDIVWDYVLDGLLLIFCIIFFIKAKQLLEAQVNKFLIEKNKRK